MSTSSLEITHRQPRSIDTTRTVSAVRWFLLVLGAFSVGLLGAIVGSYAVETDPPVVATLATAGYLIGYVLARTRIPDAAAHLITILLGVTASLIAIDPALFYRQLRAGEWRDLLDRYESLLRHFIGSVRSGDTFETEIAVFAVGLTIWLVGSTSAWLLFRQGWVFWSLAIPGAILLVTLALDEDRAAWMALVYLGLALAIAAGHTAIGRAVYWNTRGIDRPSAFGRRSIVLGLFIAAISVGTALSFSFDLDDRYLDQALNQGDRLASWAEDRFAPSGTGSLEAQRASGNYGAFSDQFKVGDGVPAGDFPIVIMHASDAEYLAARRLDAYDGVGWKSTASQAQTSLPTPPRIAFQSDQPMNVPPDQLELRAQDRATITLLQPSNQLLFTIDQHFSTSEPTLVRVGWDSIDTTFAIGQVPIGNVPVDLRQLVTLLKTESFAPQGSSTGPELEDPRAAAELDRIQKQLLATYPVTTELGWSEDGDVELHVTGRLPIYSDIEAVYSAEELSDGSYSVIGLVPVMSAADLENAGSSYPAYITDTYLRLPDSVTQQTRDLANRIVVQAGATNAFDQATAIQNYLRANFAYDIDAGPAPAGRDIVDYFLFESQIGRCDHYASSMAVMLRMLGIPARIVTGLAPVSFDTEMNGFVYRGRDAHAWVEVYFPGFGWIQFEPTPSQSPVDLDSRNGDPIATPAPTPPVEATPELQPETTQPASEPEATASPLPLPAATDLAKSSPPADRQYERFVLIGGGVAALLAILGGIVFFRRRGAFSGLSVPSANYQRLQRLGRFIGIEPAPAMTPREYATHFGSVKPASAPGALVVADAYTRERYATNVDPVRIAHDSEAGWKEAKQGASDWRFWRRR